MQTVAGVDWASEKHDVLVEDLDGVRVWAGEVAHDEQGITELCATLLAAGVVGVAVERPDGLLVERLLDAGPGRAGAASQPGQGRATQVQRVGRQERPV